MRVRECTDVRMYMCIQTYVQRVCVYTYLCMHMELVAGTPPSPLLCARTRARTHTHTYTHEVCMYIYIHVCTYTKGGSTCIMFMYSILSCTILTSYRALSSGATHTCRHIITTHTCHHHIITTHTCHHRIITSSQRIYVLTSSHHHNACMSSSHHHNAYMSSSHHHTAYMSSSHHHNAYMSSSHHINNGLLEQRIHVIYMYVCVYQIHCANHTSITTCLV